MGQSKKIVILFLMCFFLLFSCDTADRNKKINKIADEGGQAIGELATGIKHGVVKAFEPQIALSKTLLGMGLELGKCTVKDDSLGHSSILIVYLISNQDFSGSILAKVSDANGLEMGRVKMLYVSKKDDARYVEFHFDTRTEITSQSNIELE